MQNPWLTIPLADYESHMALPEIGQAQLLSDIFASILQENRPDSVAVLGCAGGNGFDRIRPEVTHRVVGLDLNPGYICQARARYEGRFPTLELFAGDVQSDEFPFEPVELIFAGLLMEYVDPATTLERIDTMLRHDGALVTVVQLPSDAAPEVTPSQYARLASLSSIMHLVLPDDLKRAALAQGLTETVAYTATSAGGKQFRVQTFRHDK